MNIECPKCGGQCEVIRHELSKRETGQCYCPVCKYKFTPIDKVPIYVDLNDRIEVLSAIERQLDSRLLSVRNPSIMLSQADRYVEQANELLAKAERIRQSLAYDCEHAAELQTEYLTVIFERDLCKYNLHAKTKVTRSMLRRVVDNFVRNFSQ